MLRVYELNCPATPVSIAVTTASPVVASGFSYHQDGNVVGPVGSALTYDLTGINLDVNKVGFLALYVRAVFNKVSNTTTFVNEVELTDVQDVNKVGTVYNQDFAKGFGAATTKSMPTQAMFIAGKAYIAGDLIRKDLEIYKAKINFTAGATFNSDDWTLVTTPDATPRAIVWLLTVANESSAQFVGGTTELDASGITTTVFTELAYNFQ